jgi:AcrR family transcriptional regulator
MAGLGARKSEAKTDGRALRGERNRLRIVEAILELIRSGEPNPTAELVARRAGVGTRSIFRHFDDMEGLYAAVAARVGDEVLSLLGEARFEGSLEKRVRQLARSRIRIYERVAPIRRREMPHEASSPAVQRTKAAVESRLRRQLHEALPELEACDPDQIEALDALLSWESWNRLRSVRRLGGERVARLLEEAATTLLDAAKLDAAKPDAAKRREP